MNKSDFLRSDKFKKAKYCSQECYLPNRATKNNPNWKSSKVQLSCVTCKKQFLVDPYLKDKVKNCSKACSNIYRASPEVRLENSRRARQQIISQYGETPEFITKLSQIIRESAKYRLWREQVWKIDNYTCQMCLKQKGKICADHIISFLEVLLNEGIDSYDKAIENGVLWDISNGRTLCYDCHFKTDNYGFKAIKLITNK